MLEVTGKYGKQVALWDDVQCIAQRSSGGAVIQFKQGHRWVVKEHYDMLCSQWHDWLYRQD